MLAIRRQEPFALTGLREEMDRLFEQFVGEFPSLTGREPFRLQAFPPVNSWEGVNHLYVEAELPGLTADDVEVTVAGTELTIKGLRPTPDVPEGCTVHCQERRFGSFSRLLRLPAEIDESAIEATMHDGVLTVTLPKVAGSRRHRIKVEAIHE